MDSDSVKQAEEDTTAVAAAATIVDHHFPPECSPAAVVIQAAWRGFALRKRYDEERTTRQWAAVKVQSFFRARKARRKFSKHVRYVNKFNSLSVDNGTL